MPDYILLPVDWRIIFKYLGTLMFPLGISLLIPLVFSLFLQEWNLVLSFFIPAIIAFGSAWFFRRNVPEKEIKFREGLIVTALSFPTSALIGSFPYWFGSSMPLLDSLFESMSGFSTAGLTIVNPEQLPLPLILWRSMTQWLGGIGFVVLTIGFLISSGSPMVRLFVPEPHGGRPSATLEELAAIILKIYFTLTFIGIITLYTTGLSLLDSICFTFSAISTGGFTPYQDNVAHFGSTPISLILMLLMLAGAIQFTLYYQILLSPHPILKRLMILIKNPQLLCLLGLISSGFFFGLVLSYKGISKLQLLFTIISAQTTTGYSIGLPLSTNPSITALLIPFMFIGGSLVSTAGGIKLLRLLVMFKVLKRLILQPFLPREEVLSSVFFGEHFPEEDIRKALGLILLEVILVFLSLLIFVWAGYDFFPSLFDITSAIATVGLSTGIVNHELLPGLKVILILLMWMGRVEVLPVLMLYYAILKNKEQR